MLKLNLKPNERVYVGKSIITILSESGSTLLIEGDVPVLRQKLFAESGQSAAAQLRYAIQQSYLDGDSATSLAQVLSLAAAAMRDEPAVGVAVKEIIALFATGQTFAALKAANMLRIDPEHADRARG